MPKASGAEEKAAEVIELGSAFDPLADLDADDIDSIEAEEARLEAEERAAAGSKKKASKKSSKKTAPKTHDADGRPTIWRAKTNLTLAYEAEVLEEMRKDGKAITQEMVADHRRDVRPGQLVRLSPEDAEKMLKLGVIEPR